MTTTFAGGSAKIYTFPARGRFAVNSQPEEPKPAAIAQLPRGVKLATGSGWYHDAAIQAEQGRTN
jgi:hypothetical protein